MIFTRKTVIGLLAIAASAPRPVNALDPDICAMFNTATAPKFTSNLQTNGLCHDHCNGQYAFSITQGYDCWCSNYAPDQAATVQLSDCNFPCYGYPQEPCGSASGAFSYVRLRNIAVSGTKGSDQPSQTTANPSSSQSDPKTSSQQPPSSSSSSSSRTSATESSNAQSSTDSTTKPTSNIVRTVTADGTVKTVFIAPTGAPNDGSTDRADGEVVNGNGGGGDGVSKGALAGIIVGVALGVIAIVGAGAWFFFKRKRSQEEEDDYQEDPSIRGSSSGMMGSGQRPEMSMSGGSPGSPNTSSNRNSALMIDPRMDPFKQGLYVRSNSHESINTLRDDHDYSRRIQGRTLRATNPDPDIDG